MAGNQFAADGFPRGSGAAQGPVPAAVEKSPYHAIVDNEPEMDGPSDFPRPKPTDPGGDNKGGWVKTSQYPTDTGHGGDSVDADGNTLFKQV
jgi:hypothetical protein